MPDFNIGDIVGYVLPDGRSAGEVRPAIVVRIWDTDTGCSQLQVFADSNGDPFYNDGLPNVFWKTSILYNADKQPGTWHFLEHD